MDGWKTWLAVFSTLVYGVGVEGIFNGNWSNVSGYVLSALALLGIGGKLTKINRRF